MKLDFENKENKQLIIILILVVLLIFVWLNTMRVIKKKARPSPPVQAALFSPAAIIEQKEENIETQNMGLQGLNWVRCPFSGKQYTYDALDLEISGIIWDQANPKAIIQGEILGVGEFIEGFRIEKIEKQKVILSNGDKKIELAI